jgi:hypothetical protein
MVLALQNDPSLVPDFRFKTATSPVDVALTGCPCALCVPPAYQFQKAQRSKIISEAKKRLERCKDVTNEGACDRVKKHLENDVMLLPGVVHAFALRSRKWGKPSCYKWLM